MSVIFKHYSMEETQELRHVFSQPAAECRKLIKNKNKNACLIFNEILQGYTRRFVQQMREESTETIDGYGIYR